MCVDPRVPQPHLKDHAHVWPRLSTLEAQLEWHGEGGEERALVQVQFLHPNCRVEWERDFALQKPFHFLQLLEENSLWDGGRMGDG